MDEAGRAVREEYVLAVDQVAAALTDTVLRTQVEAAQSSIRSESLGGFFRVDGAFKKVERWTIRLLVAGIPLAFGIQLLVAGNQTLGMLALVASLLVLLLVIGVERALSWSNRRLDSWTDPLITKSGEPRLKAAIEQGSVHVLSGTIKAELIGDRLCLRASDRTLTIPSIGAAWQARTSTHLVLAASPPSLRTDFANYALLPVGGEIAAATTEQDLAQHT